MTRSQIGLLVIGMLVLALSSYHAGKYTNLTATKPYRSVCFQDDSKELHHFTPAFWVEKDGMKHMEYERMNLRCRGDVGGFMMDWEADQFWLRRTGAKKVTTR